MAKILIIDDDAAMLETLARMVEGEGHVTVLARNGAEGLRVYRETHPDLVITDIVMPEKEGIETILELRREEPTLSVIAISGALARKGVGYLTFAQRLGADEVLAKPFRAADLLRVIDKLLPANRGDAARNLPPAAEGAF